MKKTWLPLVVLMLALPAGADEPAGNATRGKVVFERFCLSCHGELGDGNGEVAEWITPRPRDFRQGTFKWRSTPSGTLPLVSDLERTIREGLYGTYMPTWYPIGRRNRLDVIAYIQTFSDRWKKEKPAAPIEIPPEPPNDANSIAAGKETYETVQCGQCHGESGRGDGPSASTLRDDWGQPIKPYDFTSGHLKCGDAPADVYRVFMTGLNGTPMPSFSDSISPDEAWHLVHYVLSLRQKH
jgi:mono/diheme cytochrome c family protein